MPVDGAQKLSRKLVHITAGPLFMLTWPLFSWAANARFYAAVIPALNSLRSGPADISADSRLLAASYLAKMNVICVCVRTTAMRVGHRSAADYC